MPLFFESSIFDVLLCFCLDVRQQPSRTSDLPIDRLTYIGRTIPEFESLTFANGEEPHRFVVDKQDVLEIDHHFALLLSEQLPQRLDLLAFKPTTDAQDRETFLSDEPFDSRILRAVLVQAVQR